METNKKKLIVVLGMHRSGTSAITRGLQVMGVNLGDNMLPPVAGDNAKGYWEDIDINALNIEMLHAIDSEWFHLSAIDSIDVEILRKKGFFLRAIDILRKKIDTHSSFGFKDPRVAKLLPFWSEVFNHCQFEVSYVIALRNPLSVVKSLTKRGDLESTQGYLLWLEHVISSLKGSAKHNRIIVDYDHLMQSPDIEVTRVAKCIDLEINSTELKNYKTEFLDEELHHNIYHLNDLLQDNTCPHIVQEIYSALLDAASEKIKLEDSEFLKKIIYWINEFERLKSPLLLADRLFAQKKNAKQAVAERDTQIADLNQAVAERDAQIADLNQAVAEYDGQIADLNQAVTEGDGQIVNLNHTVAERDRHISALYNSSSWRIAAPIRLITHQIKRITHVAKLTAPAIKHGGGLKNTAKKALQVYRHDGFSGMKRGLRKVAMTTQTVPAEGSDIFDRNDYTEWINRFDRLHEESRIIFRKKIEEFPQNPLISVVIPTYNSKTTWLIEAIESVRNQIYPHWELCIADDSSTDKAIKPLLERYAQEDARIKLAFRKDNGHISAASNTALALASGEWVALLDHDDLLAENALFFVADAIIKNTDAALIYSDEDKITEKNQRYSPYFKCEFNYELFLAQNMICHLGVYKRSLINKLGGFRVGFEGAQDYDLALRVIENIKTSQIVHIPRILYHWRAIAGSTALASDQKNYAAQAGQKAIREHLARIGKIATVTSAPEAPALNRVRFSVPNPAPLVSIIIPTRDHANLVSMCIESILNKTTYKNYEIIIMDNGSIEPQTLHLFDALKKKGIRIEQDSSPFNFSSLNNHGAKIAKGDILCLMNNDIEVITPDWLEEMASFASQPEVGCVGARLWYPDGRLQHGGVILGIGGVAGHSHKYAQKGFPGYFGRAVLHQSFSAVTAACLAVRRSVFEHVDGLNESLAVAFNDVDFCLRVREAGFRNVWTPYAEMVHHESVSRGHENTPEKQLRFSNEVQKMHERWGMQLTVDPAYSSNLTIDSEDFSLAWPPRAFQYTEMRT